MKIASFLVLFAGAFVFTSQAEMRTFTSLDGGKTLEAEVVEFYPEKGTLKIRKSDGRFLTVPARAFSESDQEYIGEWYKTAMAGRRLAINFGDVEAEGGERRTANSKITTTKESFEVSVRNNASTEFDGLELQYRIFYYKDGAKAGTKKMLHKDGFVELASLDPRAEQKISTDAVSVERERPLPASQCVGGT